ncbi:MAG: dihydrofolate reductase family protein [Bacteroidia bacterium]
MKTKVFIAMSLDGFIAGPNESLDFLNPMQLPDTDYGYADFMAQIDTVIMGRKTYDKLLSFGGDFPFSSQKCVVWSRQPRMSETQVQWHQGPLNDLLEELEQSGSQNIYADGGQLITALLQLHKIDELIISVIPVLLGAGTPLFGSFDRPVSLRLLKQEAFASGLVQLRYEAVGS